MMRPAPRVQGAGRFLPRIVSVNAESLNVTVNGQSRQIAGPATVAQLLEQLGLAGRPVAVEVNLELVPRARHAQCALADGDRLEIVTLVGGG
jgi:sulfur carrier protein